MPALLSSVRSRASQTATAVCAVFFLGVGLVASSAKAQSDAVDRVPWQAHPCEGQQVPPPSEPARCGDCDSGRACDEGDDGNEDRCNVATDWCRFPSFMEPHDRLSFRTEYLMWWTKAAKLPALATTSPSDTARTQAGVLGQSGTEILFGSGYEGAGVRSGARFTLGYWFSDCHDVGLDVTYLFLSNQAASFDATSDGSTILARPFYDVDSAQQNSVILAYPGQQSGTLSIRDANELNSVEVLFRRALLQQCDRQLDFLIGYRYGRFNESLSMDGSTTYISSVGETPAGTVIQTSDLFDAKNEFNGAEIGFTAKSRCDRWSLELLTKLAVGNTRSRANISGGTVVTEPGQSPVSYNGGMLALPTNSTTSTYEKNDFSVIPELGVTIGYDITCRLKATVGYTFLYWSNVMRPGDQVDTNVNPTQFPPGTLSGVPSPAFKPVTTDFWAQGFNFGLEYRY